MKRERDQDLQREISTHLELESEEHCERGLSSTDARYAALRAFGNVPRTTEDARAVWSRTWLDHAARDVRLALRSLLRTPGVSTLAVVVLGLGIAATTMVATVADALLVRPLAVAEPDALYALGRAGETRARFSLEFFKALTESGSPFSDVLATFTFPVTLTHQEAGGRARAGFVSANYFDVLGLRPAEGRLFRDSDDDGVVVSHRFWMERLGSRSSIVGDSVSIGGRPFVVLGVAPAQFFGLQLDIALDLWMPIRAAQHVIQVPASRVPVHVVGRLAAGLPVETATSLARDRYRSWQASNGSGPPRSSPAPLVMLSAARGLDSDVRAQFRTSVSLLVAISLCLLLMTVVNVSGLLSARLRQRGREIGVRLALGVSAPRLLLALVAETFVLLVAGGALGLLAGVYGATVLTGWMPAWDGVNLRLSPWVLAGTVLTVGLAASLITVVQTGLFERRHVMRYLASSAPAFGRRHSVLGETVVSVQVALSIPLIVLASLLGRSLTNLTDVDAGFARTNLLQIEVEPTLSGYSVDRAAGYYKEAVERLRLIPGVLEASASSGGALSGYGGTVRLRRDGSVEDAHATAVDERYFNTLDIRILVGRTFEAIDMQKAAGAAILNSTLARRLFGDEQQALGMTVVHHNGDALDQRVVVGVVEDTRDINLRDAPAPTLYLPLADSSLLILHARTRIDPVRLISDVRRTLVALDPNVPISSTRTMEGRRLDALQKERLLALASTLVGSLATMLSAVGIFALISYAIASRAREIGIRTALGAPPRAILGLFLTQTARIVATGVLLGLPLAAIATRVARGLLFSVEPTNLGAYVSALTLVALVMILATALPLRRRLRAAPAASLRD